MKQVYVVILLCVAVLVGCSTKPAKKTAEPISPAAFSADSAYRYVREQVQFGARVPGSVAHEECYRYLTSLLTRFGGNVEVQQGSLTRYDGNPQPIVNIIAHYPGTGNSTVLLCAHWDCRPWSDQEEEYENRMTPVLGANDGASGVGVLLEIARQLGQLDALNESHPSVDIVLFDAEDMGTPDFYTGKQLENTWCLGSQLWAQQAKNYAFGILLDMVGAPDAVFPREYFSDQYAHTYVEKLWRTAADLGYGRFFVQSPSYPVTDDHYYVNTIGHIPCLDIIHYDMQSGTGFPEYWHTNHDNMQNISAVTLDAVGKTVLTMILH